MMSLIVALLALLLIGLLYAAGFKLRSSAAPLAAIATVVILLTLFGMIGFLIGGVVAVFALAVFSPIYIFGVQKQSPKEVAALYLTPGVVFFVAAFVFFALVLSLKGAALRYWDEFSFWGTASKVIHENNQLYTLAGISMYTISYPPGLPLLGYFLQVISPRFSEWQLYLAYDMLMMAALALLFEGAEWKNIVKVIALALFSIGGLYLFWWSFEGMYLYANAYADIPTGVLLGAVLLSWFRTEQKKAADFALVGAALVLLVWVRDFGFALALIAGVVIGADMVLSRQWPAKNPRRWKKALLPFALLALAVGLYLIWSLHFKLATGVDRVTIPYQYSAIEIFTGKDPRFLTMLKDIWQGIKTQPMAAFGTQLETAIVFALLPLVGAAFTRDKKRALRLGCFSLLMLAGLIVYYLFFGYLFTAVMRYEAMDYESFKRYLSSYFIGWFIGIVGVFLYEIGRPRRAILQTAFTFLALLVPLAATLYFIPHNPDQYFIASPKINLMTTPERAGMQQALAPHSARLKNRERIYLVAQGSHGMEWFWLNYECSEAYTVRSIGAGSFVGYEPNYDDPAEKYNVYANRVLFAEYLGEQEVEYVFIYAVDDYFLQEFAPMFTDGLAGYLSGETQLYSVAETNGQIELRPVLD